MNKRIFIRKYDVSYVQVDLYYDTIILNEVESFYIYSNYEMRRIGNDV